MAKRTLPIKFPNPDTITEHGEGILIHWTMNRGQGRAMCASVESTTPPRKRMVKYLRGEGR